jgi:DNA primase
MTVDQFVERLNAKPCGQGWKALCPAHEDHNASLSVNEGADGRVLLKCFTGCTTENIVAALGLSMNDLFNSEARSIKQSRTAKKIECRRDSIRLQAA